MANFKQDFTITQSEDCTTLTLQDNSNFGDNDQNYTYSSFDTKNITLYDASNNVLAILPITDSTPVTTTIPKDMYITFTYLLQSGTDTPLTKTYVKALSCFVEKKYGKVVANKYNGPDCDCSGEDNTDNVLISIEKGIFSAQIFASVGNGALSQSMLDYANSFTDTFIPNP